MENLIVSNISNFGFPAIICFYIITRVVKCIDKNTQAIEDLRDDIRKLLLK